MNNWFKKLESAYAGNDYEVRTWDTPAGSLLVTPQGGRILACRLQGVEGNLFWHSPKLESKDLAKAAIEASGGLGGDRLWIAPEAGYIFRDLSLVATDPVAATALPAEMDPGDFRIVEDTPGRLALMARMKLTDPRQNQTAVYRVGRRFDLILPPEGLPRTLKTMSFSIRNDLTLLQGPPGCVGGVWDLLQLPPTGLLICPTVSPVKSPRCYFEPFGASHVKSDKQAVRFLIDGKRRMKMGLLPTQTAGRMGYYRKVKRTSTLIYRSFHPQPGEPYVDVTVEAALQGQRIGADALQAYNDSGSFGGFGEMEYHDPAIVAGQSVSHRSGTSITHVLAGTDKSIRQAALLLLGVEP